MKDYQPFQELNLDFLGPGYKVNLAPGSTLKKEIIITGGLYNPTVIQDMLSKIGPVSRLSQVRDILFELKSAGGGMRGYALRDGIFLFTTEDEGSAFEEMSEKSFSLVDLCQSTCAENDFHPIEEDTVGCPSTNYYLTPEARRFLEGPEYLSQDVGSVPLEHKDVVDALETGELFEYELDTHDGVKNIVCLHSEVANIGSEKLVYNGVELSGEDLILVTEPLDLISPLCRSNIPEEWYENAVLGGNSHFISPTGEHVLTPEERLERDTDVDDYLQ